MTRFWRNGFWRTGVHGVEHWVEGHEVERDDWERSGDHSDPSYFQHQLIEARAFSSASARVVTPNANCPVCGAEVFFYRNEHGSRVFFDELGPPWPKHPCTDSEEYRSATGNRQGQSRVAPAARALDEIHQLGEWDRIGAFEPEAQFGTKYGEGRWRTWRVGRRLRSMSGVSLILINLEAPRPLRRYVVRDSMPRALREGELVFTHADWLSYFDTQTLKVGEVEVRQLSGASGLVEELVGAS